MRNPCCDKRKDSNYNKGAWSKEEDEKLIAYIRTHGEGCWRTLPQAAGLRRCGKSCRLRWINYLRPDLKRGNFAEDEEDLIIKLHALLGNRWSLIARRLPGRSAIEVKNYWNFHLRRKLIKMGIDPNNHRVRLIRNNYNNNNLHRLQNSNNDASDSSTATSACREESNAYEALKSQLGDNATALPDLNLDLVMNNPISPSIAAAEEENHKSYYIK